MIRLIAFIVSAMLVSNIADARSRGGHDGPTPNSPSAPSAPVDPAMNASPADRDGSAQRTNYSFVEDGTDRKVVSDFCYHWRSDRFCVKN